MTTTFVQSSTPIMFDARLKAAVGYVPYFGQIIFPAFGQFEHGLDGVTLSYLAIGGTADTTAPLAVTLQGIERLAGPRELVAITGVKHRVRRAVDGRHLHVDRDLPRCRGSPRPGGACEVAEHDERGGRRRRPCARSVQWPGHGHADPAQFRRDVVECAGRLGIGLGHQFRAPGRRDLRHLVHARRQRQGVVPDDDGVRDRAEHVHRHALSDHGATARRESLRSRAGAADRRGNRDVDVFRRQQRDVRLHRQRHPADQDDHAVGVRRAADVHVGRAREPGARGQLPGRMVGGGRGGIGMGRELHPPRATSSSPRCSPTTSTARRCRCRRR